MLQISRNCWSMLRSHHNLSQPMDFVFLKPSPTRPQKHSFPCRAKPEDHQGFRGTILYRIKVIPSYHLSPLHNQDLKIWHWGACFTRKSKTLGCRKPYLYKISSMTKMWGFVHFVLRVGVPIYRIMDLLRYSPNMSKMDGFCVLASPGFWFCSKVGVQDGSPESKVFWGASPPIL